MKVFIMNHIGSAVRINELGGKYAVELAPLTSECAACNAHPFKCCGLPFGPHTTDSYEGDFGHMDTGPGQPTSVFPSKEHAEMFVRLLQTIPEIRNLASIPKRSKHEIVCGEWYESAQQFIKYVSLDLFYSDEDGKAKAVTADMDRNDNLSVRPMDGKDYF